MSLWGNVDDITLTSANRSPPTLCGRLSSAIRVERQLGVALLSLSQNSLENGEDLLKGDIHVRQNGMFPVVAQVWPANKTVKSQIKKY